MASESELVEKGLPCEDCGSSDALALYDDGHAYCFSCQKLTPGEKSKMTGKKAKPKDTRPYDVQIAELLEDSDHRALQKWNISQATARHCDYRTKVVSPEKAQHLAVYKNETGKVVFVKVRVVTPNDTKAGFFGVGDEEEVSLYGIETLGKGGKMVVVTEGEKDRLAGSQLWANKFPVVGLPFGAESSGKAFARALPRLLQYDQIVFCLDMDKQGQEGTRELVSMCPPGKAYIARFSSKDLHQNVVDEGPEKTINAIHNAQPYRPDGIVSARDLIGQALSPTVTGTSWPWDFMTRWTYGVRPGEIIVVGGGTGIGKSDLSAEMAAHWIKPVEDGGAYEPVAIFNYEAAPVGTLKQVAGKLASKRFHLPDPDGVYWTQPELVDSLDYLSTKCAKLFINDHNGAVDWPSVKERLRYLRHAEGVRKGIVDPLAALVAQEDDDRKALDRLFAEGKSLAEELGMNLIFLSHLTRPSMGPSHEEGGRVELKHFRGSNAIGMWSSFVFGLERDQQSDDVEERGVTTIRVLKDRFSGDSTGKTQRMFYNTLSGRLEVPVLELDRLEQDSREPEAPEL